MRKQLKQTVYALQIFHVSTIELWKSKSFCLLCVTTAFYQKVRSWNCFDGTAFISINDERCQFSHNSRCPHVYKSIYSFPCTNPLKKHIESSNPIQNFQFESAIYIPRRAIQSRVPSHYIRKGKSQTATSRRRIDTGVSVIYYWHRPPRHYTIWTLTHATLVALTHSLSSLPFFFLLRPLCALMWHGRLLNY